MRVLVTIAWGQRLGGAEVMLQSILDERQREHEIELVFLQGGPWPAELADAGYRVHVLDSGRLRQVHRYLATVARLAALYRRRRPDVILNWSAKTQLYGSPAAAIARMSDRVIWWQHDIPAHARIDLLATRLPARAIGTTSASAAAAQLRLRPARETFVVHAGTAPPTGARANANPPLDLPRGVPVVGIVGRLQPWKGQDRLLRAQALLRERGIAMHLVIVGGDSYELSPAYARSLDALVAELGLSEEVTMTGEVPDAGPYIEQMDVLVNASDPEPFGIVLLEALARSVAVVAVDAGGPRELIEHRRTGMLASSGEPAALADALEPLLRSAELRRSVGEAGRARFENDLTDTAMRERFFAALTRVAERR